MKVVLLKVVFREKRRGKTRLVLGEDTTGETVDISETVDLPEDEARELLARGIARKVAEVVTL